MTIATPRGRRAAALLALLAMACGGDEPTTPRTGTLTIAVQSTGGDLDVDGYDVVIDATRRLPVLANATITVSTDAGTHTVALERVAGNCTVGGAASRSVTVASGQALAVDFAVACLATGIDVRMRTTGVDRPNSHRVSVDTLAPLTIDANGSQVVSRLQAGRHTARLLAPRGRCTVAGSEQVTIDVPANTVTPVTFEVACAAVDRPERIAFAFDSAVVDLDSSWIALIDPDGSHRATLGPGDAPAWSPDGRRLLLSTTVCGPSFYYYYFVCHGSLFVRDPEVGDVTEVGGGQIGMEPGWAPADSALVFLRCCRPSARVPGIFRTTLGGAPAVEVSIPMVTVVTGPAWSPDGRRIAFGCVIEGTSGFDLCVVDPDGTRLALLTSGVESDTDPAWSPDGTRIAFTRRTERTGRVERTEIALVVVDGGAVTRLTDGADPAWSRDGRRLVFVGDDGLHIIGADGANRTRLTTGAHRAPAWRP